MNTPDRSSSQAFVLDFCAGHTAWNDDAYTRSSRAQTDDESIAAMRSAEVAYWDFLSDYVAPKTTVQLAASGSAAALDPKRLRIQSVVETPDQAEVHLVVRSVGGNWEDEYLVKLIVQPTLAICQVYCLDPFPHAGVDRLPFL